MLSADEVDESELDRFEQAGERATSGSHDHLSFVPLVAVGIVAGSLLFAFATLGG